MNSANFELASGLISARYVKQAQDARRRREGLLTTLLSQRRMPKEGWDDQSIEMVLQDLAAMDSNNFIDNVGAGEREGRVYSRLVRNRYFGMSHGVGRSGDLTAEQPKAAGSSLLSKITHLMALHALKVAGLTTVSSCIILPLATGMSIAVTLLSLKNKRPNASKVIWPRIDQKTCLKSIVSVGLQPLVVENTIEGDEARTDLAAIEAMLRDDQGKGEILCVISTTSCFAPRAPERVVEVAVLCRKYNTAHLINNAYGCQSRATMTALTSAGRKGRIDGIIQSTDKNFMVPVGGAILAAVGGPDSESRAVVSAVSAAYPGRASGSSVMDLFITLLSMGEQGYRALLDEREALHAHLVTQVAAVAAAHGERLLNTQSNPISLAITLDSFVAEVIAATAAAAAHSDPAAATSAAAADTAASPDTSSDAPATGSPATAAETGAAEAAAQDTQIAGPEQDAVGSAEAALRSAGDSAAPAGTEERRAKAGVADGRGRGSGGGAGGEAPGAERRRGGRPEGGGSRGGGRRGGDRRGGGGGAGAGAAGSGGGDNRDGGAGAGVGGGGGGGGRRRDPRERLSELGGLLFARSCSGSRVVTCCKGETVGGVAFRGYGSHVDGYPHPYLAMACAVGMTRHEADDFVARLDRTLGELRRRIRRDGGGSGAAGPAPAPTPPAAAAPAADGAGGA